MGDSAQEASQHQVGPAVGLVVIDHSLQPLTVRCVSRRILSVSIDQDIDVR
jgi:hypothetical protein